jgi:hypothetical protein
MAYGIVLPGLAAENLGTREQANVAAGKMPASPGVRSRHARQGACVSRWRKIRRERKLFCVAIARYYLRGFQRRERQVAKESR